MAHNSNKGRTLSTKGIPRPNARGARPQVWVTGPDPVLHEKYRVWLQQRNQAQWRDEGWHIGFTDWCGLWAERWESRGRTRGSYCMTRIDWSLAWTLDNVKITTREEHAKLQGDARAKGWSSIAQKRARARRGQMTLELTHASDD